MPWRSSSKRRRSCSTLSNVLEKSYKAMSVGFLLSRDLVQSSQQERNPESVDRHAVYANWFVFRIWMFRQSSITRYFTLFSTNLHTTDVKTNLAIIIPIGFTTFFKQRCNVSKFMDATVYLLIMICWLKKHKSSDKTFAHAFRIRGDKVLRCKHRRKPSHSLDIQRNAVVRPFSFMQSTTD